VFCETRILSSFGPAPVILRPPVTALKGSLCLAWRGTPAGKVEMPYQAKANLTALIESTDDLIWSVDLDYRLITFNQALQRAFEVGYGVKIEPGMTPRNFLPPERAALFPPLYLRALSEGPFRTEYILSDGRTVELAFNPIVTDGVNTGISVFGKDITERKNAESALRQAEEKYRAIFDGALEGIFRTSLESKPLAANPAIARILGYGSPQELLSSVKSIRREVWLDPEERDRYVQLVKEQGAWPVLGYECRFKRKDGSVVWVSLNSRIVCAPDGKPLYNEGFLVDITQRKQAEESLRESGDFLKEAQKFGNLGYYVLDIFSGVWTASEAMDYIFGIEKNYPHTLEGWTALIHPDERAIMTDYFINEVVGRRKDFDKEYRIVRASDHAERWVHGTGRLEFDPQGQPLEMHGIIKDITDRKLAEMQLRDSEASYRSTFEQAAVGIVHATFAGLILHYNARFAAILGYTAGELYGINVQQITAPEDRAVSLETMQRILSCATDKESLEKRYLRKDGSMLWVKITLSLQRDAEGRALRFIAVVEDINDRKIAEQRLANAMEALRLSETHYRTVFQTTPDAIIIARVADGTIIDANQAFLDSSRFKRREVIGRTSLDLGIWVDPSDRQTLHDALARTGECRDLNVRSRRKDGEIFWMRLSASLIEIGGAQCTITFAKDITEAKIAEERLAEAADALRKSEAHYRTVFQTSVDGIAVSQMSDGKYVDANEAFLRLMGYERDEVIGHTSLELNLWVDPEVRQKMVAALHEHSTFRGMQTRYVRKNGEIIWIVVSATVIEIEGVPCILSVIQDISATKAAEQRLAEAANALQASEQRYRTVFLMNSDAVDICHLEDGRFIDVNDAFVTCTGFKRDEAIGRTALELGIWANPGDRNQLLEIIRRDGSCRNLEAQYLTKDGSLRWGLLSVSAVELDGVPCILSVTRDITEAKATEERLTIAAEALRSSEERYRKVFESCFEGIIITRTDNGACIDVNQRFLDSMGFERQEVIGHTPAELKFWMDESDRENLLQILRRDSMFKNYEARFRRKNGQTLWAQLEASIIAIDGVACLFIAARDISDAKAAEERLAAATEALRASEERYRATFQLSIDAININRLSDGVFVDVNEAFLHFVGFEREEVIGRTSQDLNFWVDPGVRQQMVETLSRGESCRDLEARFRRKNGEIVWGQASESILEIDGVSCILSVTRNISAAKAAEEQIRDLAFYDPLTHLPNRRLLMERLRQSLVASSRTNRKRALLFVDLDNFKTLNDTLGHKTGDLLLQEVGVRLAACIRESDTVARLGGDEFVVMLEDLSDIPEEAASQAELVGEKILAAIDQPFWLSSRECLSTCSIGITVFGDKRENTDEVLQQADIAMYQAKTAGRNTMRFFAPALQAAVNARAALEEDIRQAIKFSQFELYYQPQFDSIGLVGAEALIRWNHPRRGLLLPGEFIHLSEETGLIIPLGDWVLENAFAQVAAWAGRPDTSRISLAINISARQFRQTSFVDKVLATIDRTGVNPQNIKLELTESMLVDNIEDIIAKMTVLKSHGLKFSLDDFGTGYSSLAYLKRLPLDQLKIDSSFVRDILADVGSRAIAQSVISLGRALGLSVIAECVETEEQRALLSSIGCHAFQGFLFSRAIPLEAFERQWLSPSAFIVPVAG
jgi:diguanylate cyclase (GGDEF)-like protein/PAS domain S-box-containing protein